MITDFRAFPSIPRLSKEMVISEKIDGTNACIVIDSDWNIQAQSRSRIITPDDDNMWFAYWVEKNQEELKSLWEWYHYWEWWGGKIQRGYWLKEKRFSLFFYRWEGTIPSIVSVVPVLYTWDFCTQKIDEVMEDLCQHGSYAADFMNPEGIVIYHTAWKCVFKKTFDNDWWKFTAK